MKKLLIKVNGKEFEVEFEIPEGEEFSIPSQNLNPTPKAKMENLPAPKVRRTEAATRAASNASGNILNSPLNGVILEICVKQGQEVKEGDELFVLEAMKMKTSVSSARDGKVGDILVATGETIEAGKPMLNYL